MRKMTDAQLRKLAKTLDEEIDYSDIPATKNFEGWVKTDNNNFDNAIKKSIIQQKIKVDWDDINVILEKIYKANQKSRISLRLDSDVTDYYKKLGKKYQTRINDILRAFMIAEVNAHHRGRT